MLLLSRLDRDTSGVAAAAYMLVLGLGLGMVMQVLILAVQNAVAYEELGVATSGATLFRSIGGSLGTAVLGAVFANRLSTLQRTEDRISAFTDAVSLVFIVAACVTAVAFVLTWLLEERPLRRTVKTDLGKAFAVPADTTSMREVARELSDRVGREGVREFLRLAARRAELEVTPAESFLLYRAASEGSIDVSTLAGEYGEHLRDACRDLHARGLLTRGPEGATGLTEAGARAVDALADARRCALEDLAAEWEPRGDPHLARYVRELADDLATQPA
jgi:hypothetical protein